MFKKIHLTNIRLAFFLIAILAILMILSAIIPQQDFSEEQIVDWQEILGKYYNIIEKLGLDRIYYTPFFFIVLGLLGATLLYGNIKRMKILFKVKENSLKMRYVGSIVFHLSLILIIIAAILNFLYKFEGVFALTEGQPAYDIKEGYFRIFEGPLYIDEYARFQLRLNAIDSLIGNGNNISGAELEFNKPGSVVSEKAFISTNRPYRMNDLEFHYGLFTGYSPELLLADTTGKDIFRGFVRLAIQKIRGQKVHADFVYIPGTDFKISLEIMEENAIPDSILFKIVVEKNSEIMYEDSVNINQKVRFDKYEVSIPGLRRWCYINVIKSPFLNWIFMGFWLALAGMLIGFTGRVWGGMKKST